MDLPTAVRMVEVGPRDGLQNEPSPVPTEIKIEFINRLSETGLRAIEATSFVSPAWVPQLADNGAVMVGIERRPGVTYSALTPNLRGLEGRPRTGGETSREGGQQTLNHLRCNSHIGNP